MLNWLRKRLRKDEKGQGMVEFGLILALVSVVAIGSLSGLGEEVSGQFDEVVGAMGGSFVVKGDPIYPEDAISKKVAEENYIPISTPEELDALRNGKEQTFGQGTAWEKEYTSGLNKKYIQVADINLGGIENFEPIGSDGNRFSGTFDGGGYTINNLTINRSEEGNVGLFGYAVGSTLTNISLENVDVQGQSRVGGLVGNHGTQYQSSSVSNSYVTGKVRGTGGSVGGLLGYSHSGQIRDSHSTAQVTGAGSSVGGLIGQQLSWNIIANTESSYATGKVFGRSNVGGLIGYQIESVVNKSYATGKVVGEERVVGGLVGQQGHHSVIKGSYATGKVTGDGNSVGGLLGSQSVSSVTHSGWANDVNVTGIGTSGNDTTFNAKGLPKLEVDKIIKNLIK